MYWVFRHSEFWVSNKHKPTKHMRLYSDKWRKSASVLLPAAYECFGGWIILGFQQMFYGACRVSVLDCQGALSFSIFRKCEYEASPKERKKKKPQVFSFYAITRGNFIKVRRVWTEVTEMSFREDICLGSHCTRVLQSQYLPQMWTWLDIAVSMLSPQCAWPTECSRNTACLVTDSILPISKKRRRRRRMNDQMQGR